MKPLEVLLILWILGFFEDLDPKKLTGKDTNTDK
jgi:hypothetical protein